MRINELSGVAEAALGNSMLDSCPKILLTGTRYSLSHASNSSPESKYDMRNGISVNKVLNGQGDFFRTPFTAPKN